MRRLATPLVIAALLLAGCSGSGDASDPTSSQAAPSDQTVLDNITVEGEEGQEPTITADFPVSVSTDVARLVSPGTGEELQEGQLVSFNLVGVSGADGSAQGSTYSGGPVSYLLSTDGGLSQAMVDVLVGQKVGARVLSAGPRQEDSSTTVTIIWAFEVTTAQYVLPGPSGVPVTPEEGLPTVTLADGGAPSITPVDTDPPTELVVQTLTEGNGIEVSAESTAVVNYSGWLWDGTSFDSSWDRGQTVAFALTQVIDGWAQGLTGQTVGSQVLVIIPPDLGYGDTATDTIPAGSTLIFVVDILAAT